MKWDFGQDLKQLVCLSCEMSSSGKPSKRSRSVLKIVLKLLGTSHSMEVMDNGATTQIKEVLAHASIAGTSPLPPSYTSQDMFDRSPFASFGSPAGVCC